MNRRERARLRRVAWRWAHDYLDVKRLPAGVPAIVRAWADSWPEWPEPSDYGRDRSLQMALRPYRKLGRYV